METLFNLKNRRTLTIFWVVVLILTVTGCKPYTVMTVAEATRIAEGEAFDAVSFVEAKWDDITSTILEKGVDLSTVLGAMQPDSGNLITKDNLQGVADQYGLTTEGNAQVFMVKGQGTVTDVNTEKSTGYMTVNLDGYDGPITVKFYIGKRIPSDETSVRDAVGFISFGDFREQTEYGKVGRELNKRVLAEVLADLDKENLNGKPITFYGTFTVRTQNIPGDIDVSEIVVTPTRLEVGG
jgi:predicted lipoprotein